MKDNKFLESVFDCRLAYRKLTFGKRLGDSVFVAENEEEIIFSFCGTDDFISLFRNFLTLFRLNSRIIETVDKGKIIQTEVDFPLSAWRGLRSMGESPFLWATAAKKEGKLVRVSGHSRGGQLATTFSLLLHADFGVSVDSCITFGSPFSFKFDGFLNLPFFNISIVSDPVVVLSRLFGLDNVGTTLIVRKDASLVGSDLFFNYLYSILNLANWKFFSSNHSLDAYESVTFELTKKGGLLDEEI